MSFKQLNIIQHYIHIIIAILMHTFIFNLHEGARDGAFDGANVGFTVGE